MCHVILFSEFSVVKSFHIRSICFLKWGGVWKKRGKRGEGRGVVERGEEKASKEGKF